MPPASFSKSQRKKPATLRKCMVCTCSYVATIERDGTASTPARALTASASASGGDAEKVVETVSATVAATAADGAALCDPKDGAKKLHVHVAAVQQEPNKPHQPGIPVVRARTHTPNKRSGKRKSGGGAVLDQAFEVEAVLTRKHQGGKYLYWVQWKGYGEPSFLKHHAVWQ